MEENEPRPPSPGQLSKVPSWISLGFVLGALFVWALPSRDAAPPASVPAEPPPEAPAPVLPALPPSPSDIEVVFAAWGDQAIWVHDLSEVALWDTQTRQFTRYYEVLRSSDSYYFRSIDRLTRPILTHGVKADCPLLFTETEAMRQEWLRERRQEDWQVITDSIPKPAPPVPIGVSPKP